MNNLGKACVQVSLHKSTDLSPVMVGWHLSQQFSCEFSLKENLKLVICWSVVAVEDPADKIQHRAQSFYKHGKSQRGRLVLDVCSTNFQYVLLCIVPHNLISKVCISRVTYEKMSASVSAGIMSQWGV